MHELHLGYNAQVSIEVQTIYSFSLNNTKSFLFMAITIVKMENNESDWKQNIDCPLCKH